MESFESIQQKEFEQLTGEIGAQGRKLVELGWSRDQVLDYVTHMLDGPTGNASGEPNASRKED